MAKFYYQYQGDIHGPVTGTEVRRLAVLGVITPQTLVRIDESEWVGAINVRNLFDEHGNPIEIWPPKQNQAPTSQSEQPNNATETKMLKRRFLIPAIGISVAGLVAVASLLLLKDRDPTSKFEGLLSIAHDEMLKDTQLAKDWLFGDAEFDVRHTDSTISPYIASVSITGRPTSPPLKELLGKSIRLGGNQIDIPDLAFTFEFQYAYQEGSWVLKSSRSQLEDNQQDNLKASTLVAINRIGSGSRTDQKLANGVLALHNYVTQQSVAPPPMENYFSFGH